ncbi:MAG TPA: guanylate kinase [Acidimicrobiales bacterium]|nr:guanylate kinase [Acidimicrobiales bacterium]
MILVLSGPGGVGKGTVVRRLLDVDPRLRLSRSWTTRPRRPGEPEDAYTFVDEAAFDAHLARDGFLEHDEFLGNLYGTPVPEALDDPEHDLLLEINVQGAEQVRHHRPDALVVLLVAPTRAVQEARLRARGDDDDHVAKRLAIADVEEAKGLALADAVVVNDDLDRAVAEVAGIVGSRRPGP